MGAEASLAYFTGYVIEKALWVLYVFGGLLVVTGIRMATQAEHRLPSNRTWRPASSAGSCP